MTVIPPSIEGPERCLFFDRYSDIGIPERDPSTRISELQTIRQRQIGWLGQTGNVYRVDEPPSRREEPGSYSPIYMDIEP